MKKTATEDRLAARDLFPAIWGNDLFFDRVKNNGQWTLFDPREVPDLHTTYGDEFNSKYLEYEKDTDKRKQVVEARELWEDIMNLYYTTGSPFILFKDEVNRRHQCPNIGIVRSSNLCVEIMNATATGDSVTNVYFKDDGSVLTLDAEHEVRTDTDILKKVSKLNSTDFLNGRQVACIENKIINEKIAVCNLASINLGKFDILDDYSELRELVRITVRALDNVIDINFYPIKAAKDTNLESRSIGLGAMGEHHYLAKRGIMYGSQEHLEVIDELYERISYYAIEASIDLASEKGSYPAFEGSNWSKGILPIDTAKSEAEALTKREYVMDWDSLRERAKGGIRNGYIMAIAPTSTISVHTSTTSSVEPIFKKMYIETNGAGNNKVIAPDLNPDTWNFYEGAYDIDQMLVIKAAAVRQKWIDQSQSLTLFVKSGTVTGEELTKFYLYGKKVGIKSFYYLRSLSPDELNSKVVSEDHGQICDSCQ